MQDNLTLIASGAQSSVYFITGKQIKYAIKRFKKKKHFEHEARILKLLKNHSNIIQYIETDKINQAIFMEYHDTTLKSYIENNEDLMKYISMADFKNISMQIVEAMIFCHANNVYHLDIKPSNILFNQKEKKIILCDFGYASSIRVITKKVGTLAYMAPEFHAEMCSYYADKADIWSFAVTILHLLINKPIFKEANYSDDTYKYLFMGDINAFWNTILPDDLIIHNNLKRDIITILSVDVYSRPSFNKIRDYKWNEIK